MRITAPTTLTHRLGTPLPPRPRRAGRRPQRVFDGRPHSLASASMFTQQKTGLYTQLAGRAAPYDVATPRWFYHLALAPGCWDKTCAEHGLGLPLLLFHDHHLFPVGTATEWDTGGDGLDGLWRLDSSEAAQEAARLADGGFLTGMSVGFTSLIADWQYTDWEDWDPSDMSTWDTCTVIEARLDETSLTPTPAYQEARVAYALGANRFTGGTVVPGYPARPGVARPHLEAARDWLAKIAK